MRARVRNLALLVGLALLAWIVPPASPLPGSDSPPPRAQDDRLRDATVVAVEINDVAGDGAAAGAIHECSVTYRSTRPRGPGHPESQSPVNTTVLTISIRHESAR